MTAMRSPDRGDAPGVSRSREPVMNGCPDLAPLHGRLAGAMVTRDQQQDAISAVDRLIETAIDRVPGAVESHSVKVQCAIGLDIARSEAPVPSPVERHAVVRLSRR
jgi:hypothetical protein